jgi:ABC-type branched-subunit amino acid transport system substrate-binding protein
VNVDEALRRLPRRGRTFALLSATVCTLLIAGLTVPFIIGEEPTESTSAQIDLDTEGLLDPDGADPGLTGDGAPTSSTVAGGDSPASDGAGGPSAGPGGTPSDAAGPAAPAGTGAAALTASDVGVTPDAIRLVVFVADLGEVAKLGFQLDSGDQAAAFDGFVAETNAAGGVHGRKLQIDYVSFDPLDQDDMRRACITATEDVKAFSTMNLAGFYGAAILCVTEEHGTPYATALQHEPAEWYRRSKGLMVSYLPNKDRILRQMVADLDGLKLLKGRKIGVVDSAFTADKLSSETALLPALKERGYAVAHRSTIPEAADQAAAAISVEIEQMRSKGVDTILFAVNFLVQQVWVQQASNRGYNPRYHVSDMGGGATDAGTNQMPASYDGTVGFTSLRTGEERAGLPEHPGSPQCRKRWSAATGQPMERTSPNAANVVGACILMTDFVRAARAVGPDLRRAAIPAQYERFGQFEVPGVNPGSFGPGKYDAVDFVRTVQWKASCKCWHVASPFREFSS